MKVTVTRNIFTSKSTIGMVDIDGVFQCYCLEPPKREEKPCCIPAQTYQAKKRLSPHFKKTTVETKGMVVWIKDVPGFTDVEWHVGNFPEDTKACTLVGQNRGEDCVFNSGRAFTALMAKLPDEFEVTYLDHP